MNKTLSYTAANTYPVKLIKNRDVLEGNRIKPVHIQLSPTNKCNLKCGFCSCKNENRDTELSFEEIQLIISKFSTLGTKAVTITGGGEPLMHPDINEIIAEFHKYGIEVGLVTNGLLLRKLFPWDSLTWVRISCSDERKFDKKLYKNLNGGIDYAFSYVATRHFDPDNLSRYIDFANQNNFTHVRVVSDLIDLDSAPLVSTMKTLVSVPDDLVIYQGRRKYEKGNAKCYISLLKPLIAADGKIYPCCGVQYAKDDALSFPDSMCMGNVGVIEDIWGEQKVFDGSKCKRCYYGNYNDILSDLVSDIKHLSFV